jgi:hypothetical protein
MRSHHGCQTQLICVIDAVLNLLSPVALFLDIFYTGTSSTGSAVRQPIIARWGLRLGDADDEVVVVRI